MKIPYGVSNFGELRSNGYFYVDKTHFLPDQFDALFDGLWIHRNPTPERHRYLVLSLDFSQVATDGGIDALRRTFFTAVRLAIVDLVRSFRDRIPALDGLQRIGMLTGAGRDERRSLLESILTEGGIQTSLVRQLGVASLSSQASFLSLLYYMGMLTLGQQPPYLSVGAVGYRLEIPNRVIRELQWEHLALLLKEEANLAIDTARKHKPGRTR
jgi:hypothetical protein